MKTCLKCNREKDTTQFSNGRARCKMCMAEEGRQRRAGTFVSTRIFILPEDIEATCRICDKTKSIEDFSKSPNTPSGFTRTCKSCRATEEQRRRNVDPRPSKHRNLKSLYGISIEDWEWMLLLQDNKCAVCKTDDFGKRGPFVDHNHECCPGRKTCGQCLRGIVCHHCNIAIGQIESGGWSLIIPQIEEYLNFYKQGGRLDALQNSEAGQQILCGES